MKIYPIVEGEGEVDAVPVLLRRLMIDEARCFSVGVGVPIRRKQYEFMREAELRKAVRLASSQPECAGILVLFDLEDGCPKEYGPRAQAWASSAAGSVPCEVVIAYREYESWFLASLESLRGKCGILADASSPSDPDAKRDAKGEIDRRMPKGFSYSPTIHQAKLTASFDMVAAYGRSRSFRKLTKAIGTLLEAVGESLPHWPPPNWTGTA